MSERKTSENILNSLVELAENASRQKSGSGSGSGSFFEEENSSSVTTQFNRLFGREKPVYHILGGGKSADVLLWRNKKISASVLTVATIVWILFEWLNYNFLPLVCFALVIGMVAQFLWSNASGFINRSPSKVPRVHLPNEFFVNVGKTVGAEVNRDLKFLQDVACGGNFKQFFVVLVSLLAAAIIGSWCNFLTVLYVGFVGAHILPVVYERYDDQIDDFVYKILGQVQNNYKKLDTGLLSRIPKGKLGGFKFE